MDLGSEVHVGLQAVRVASHLDIVVEVIHAELLLLIDHHLLDLGMRAPSIRKWAATWALTTPAPNRGTPRAISDSSAFTFGKQAGP